MTKKNEKTSSFAGERVAKYLARAGVASRREIERMIEAGRISVDGVIIRSPALNISGHEPIYVDGKKIARPEDTRLWCYHKKAGLLTTHKDPKGRPTVFENLPSGFPRVVSVGRLDYNTEGLLLLTNDGSLARHLELPAHAWLRRYRVRVHGAVDEKKLKALEKGVTIDGVMYEPIKAALEKTQSEGANHWLSVSIREGKNREVRKIMAHLGLEVTRLIRVSFGPFHLGKLPRGMAEEVPQRALREALGGFFKKESAS